MGRDAVERAARASYGRLVAHLAVRTRDMAAAEDALGEALVAALERWPQDGVPENPEAWLAVVARRSLIDGSRRARVAKAAGHEVWNAVLERMERGVVAQRDNGHTFDDERLGVMFACCHPAVGEEVRAPLMLQVVLGVDAAAIASAFLVPPATMSQRLVRAKEKIRDAGIALSLPETANLRARLPSVLDAVYAAYGLGWEASVESAAGTPAAGHAELADDAVWLATHIAERLPDEPEAWGLLALLLYCESRRGARRGPGGAFIPLDEQDTRRWDAGMIDRAERLVHRAAARAEPGRYQIEAAIQSAHAHRRISGRTDWDAIDGLYAALMAVHPSVGAAVGWAAARAHAASADAALALLNSLADEDVRAYQPYWAVRAHVLEQLGRTGEAAAARTRAIGLSEDPAVRAFLSRGRGGDGASG